MAKDKKQPSAVTTPKTEWTSKEIYAVMQRAQDGNRTALAEMTPIMMKYPGVRQHLQDIAEKTQTKLIESVMATDNLLLKQEWAARLANLRKELEGDHPTPLERTLIERVVTCYLATNTADISATTSGMSLDRAEYYDRRAERAQRRYLAAAESLARIRRLEVPVQQINIAQPGSQQINQVNTDSARERLTAALQKALGDAQTNTPGNQDGIPDAQVIDQTDTNI